ncbi:MAG: nicotinamide-nucleotide amidohydrolase family protein [Deltaproteobacteria bacterium]|nr:nicotinamide-nucleotide amidohydrolase family protein [Deltaproteobacteria bacterium]
MVHGPIMKVAIVTTGDEIMAGNVVDTNAAWMSDHCWKIGAKVVWRFAVGDELKEIGEACRLAGGKADVVLVSGGLGPTADDITLEAVEQAFHQKMDSVGKAIPNKVGTAPGCQVTLENSTFFFLPGVPKELYPMFDDFVLPWIREKTAGKISYREKVLKCFGPPEATIDSLLKGVELNGVRLSFRVHFPEVWLKLAGWGGDLGKAKKNVYARVGKYIFAEDEATLPQAVGELLQKKKATLSLAESCTGGFLADWITDVPGASRYFERGVVSYSNEAKMELLSVKKETLKKHGAVSEPVAKEMAEGIRKQSGATYALAITGIAGPSGGTKAKPIGTVYIALAAPKKTEVKHFCFPRDRLEFKQLVAATALDWLRRELL